MHFCANLKIYGRSIKKYRTKVTNFYRDRLKLMDYIVLILIIILTNITKKIRILNI